MLSRTPKGRVYKTVPTKAAPQGPCTGTGTHVKALGSRPLLAPLLDENPGGGAGSGENFLAAAGVPASTETQTLRTEEPQP